MSKIYFLLMLPTRGITLSQTLPLSYGQHNVLENCAATAGIASIWSYSRVFEGPAVWMDGSVVDRIA